MIFLLHERPAAGIALRLAPVCLAVFFCLSACSGRIGFGPDAGDGEREDAADAADGDPGEPESGEEGEVDGGETAGDGFDGGGEEHPADDGTDGGSAEESADGGGDEESTDGGWRCVDRDLDGHCREVDCDDLNGAIYQGAEEICGNALDDDCNGRIDENCQPARTFYVDKNSLGGACSDSSPGSIGSPWCTVAKANASLRAGDTVLIRAGAYQETIQPANSGTSPQERVVFAAYPGEQVEFTASVYCVRLSDRSYVTVRGIRFFNCQRNLYLSNSSYNNIISCEFDTPAGPATWAGSRIYNGSRYNRISHCVFSRYGNESSSGGQYDDNGCVLDIGNDGQEDRSDYNLVVHSTFFYGGHHVLGVYSNYNVIRYNTFHNEEWYFCHRTEIGGRCGNRNVILNTSRPDINIRNVIEDNHIVFSGVPPDQVASAGLSVRTRHNIIRRNIFYHNDSSGVALSVDGRNANDASGNFIYHNVFYSNGYMLLDDWNPRKNGLMLARWADTTAYNPMTGVVIKNNIFYRNNRQAISYYYVNPVQQVVAGNWEEQGDPLFVRVEGTPDPFDFDFYDFRLRPQSPCIDRGVFLTRAAGSGANDTSLQVEDAGYFSDGRGLVAGDVIMLEGNKNGAMIVAVDYQNNVLTLDRPLSWQQGSGVGLVYYGNGPDQGLWETGW